MRKKIYEQVYSVIKACVDLGIAHLVTDNKGEYPKTVNVNGKKFINFSLCDYLGLSTDKRVKDAAIRAVSDYGVYTAVSKTYVKLKIYDEAEEQLQKVFNKPCLLFPRTTLAHIGTLPAITDTDDAIVIDHQAHTSMRISTDIIKSHGNHIETIRHNNMNILEDKIKELKNKYRRVFYLADSVYSMFGDTLPANDLQTLLNKYEQFYLYVDDAHGMSWEGENGKGYLLNNLPYHPRMILITSLGKGFGAGGGIVVCQDEKMKNWLSTCSSPLIFSLPVAPATLGAIIESAKIHLTSEIYRRQSELRERIDLFKNISQSLEIPIIDNLNTPVFFIAGGKSDFSNEVCQNVMKRGYFLNVSHYPAVPVNNSGIRITLSLHQSTKDISNLLYVLKDEYDKALRKREISLNDILKHFKNDKDKKSRTNEKVLVH